MNVMMKKTALGVIAAMIGAGCALLTPDEERNEVVRDFERYWIDGASVFCIEEARISTGNAIKVSDVYVVGDGVLQTYRIEGRKVINYHWLDNRNRFAIPKNTVTEDEKKAFSTKECVMREAFWELPNRLAQGDMPFLSYDTTVTIISMWHMVFFTPPLSSIAGPIIWDTQSAQQWTQIYADNLEEVTLRFKRFCTWNEWHARQWIGTPEETPMAIEAFRQAMEQAVSAPECARKYRSYLRAVPLFTEADAEADRGSPVIDPKKARYHVHCALQHPYLLIPVPEWVSPFPAVPRYKPGDKFKVREGGNYFLIETFKGK